MYLCVHLVVVCVFVCVCFWEWTKEAGYVERVWIKRTVGSRLYAVLNAWLRSLACEEIQLLWSCKLQNSKWWEASERRIDSYLNWTASEEKHVLWSKQLFLGVSLFKATLEIILWNQELGVKGSVTGVRSSIKKWRRDCIRNISNNSFIKSSHPLVLGTYYVPWTEQDYLYRNTFIFLLKYSHFSRAIEQ